MAHLSEKIQSINECCTVKSKTFGNVPVRWSWKNDRADTKFLVASPGDHMPNTEASIP